MKTVLACAFSYLCLCVAAYAADEGLTKEQFLAALDAFQAKTRNIEFEVLAKQYDTVRGTGQLRETPYYYKTRIVMAEAPGRRVRFEREASLPWVGNNGKPMGRPALTMEQYAFNGKTATYIEWDTPAMVAPLHQWVLSGRPNQEIRGADYQSSGLALVAAYYDDAGLAQRLREAGDWTLTRAADGVFVVRARRNEYRGDRLIREITVDFNHGGAIVGTKDFVEEGALNTGYRNVVLKDFGDGIWMPESADSIMAATVLKYSFSNVKLNQSIPDSAFTLEFAPAHQVWDRRTGIKYLPDSPFRWLKYVSALLVGVMSPAGAAFVVLLLAGGAAVVIVRRGRRV